MKRAGLCVLVGVLLAAIGVAAANSAGVGEPAWAAPSAKTLKKVGAASTEQQEPHFLSNLDCSVYTYRTPTSDTMQTGCFMPSAFGMIDEHTGNVVFNGTDEALPLTPYMGGQGIVPWPKALNTLSLMSSATGGSYVNMYRNLLPALEDVRNPSGQLVAKKLTAGPEVTLHDEEGRKLLINSQTLAFSSSGSWMVAETMYGVFVRINLATLDGVAFAPAFGTSGSPGLLDSEVAVSDSGRYVAIENRTASSFRVYDLTDCGLPSESTKTPTACRSYEYWPFLGQQIPGLRLITHLRFINEGLLSFNASDNFYELAPTSDITFLADYIGLGDSYTSGEGAFDYRSGTDTATNRCHQSVNSYPLLVARDMFGSAASHSVACSGAVMRDVGSTSSGYRGQARGAPTLQELEQQHSSFLSDILANFTPGYVPQHRFVQQYQPRIATVSVGGNDIGFGDILQICVAPHVSLHADANNCYSSYESRLELTQLIDRTVPKWVDLYRQLRKDSPETQLYVVGYPQIVAPSGTCDTNVLLSSSERVFAEELIAYLNGAIQQAATTAHVPFVDISQALVGHRLCEAHSATVGVNGLTAGTDAGPFGFKVLGAESYHPNALGQQLIEEEILRQTHNFTLYPATPLPPNPPTQLLDAPKSGRAVYRLVPASGSITAESGRVVIHIGGPENALLPRATFVVHAQSESGAALGSLVSDASGSLAGEVPLPVDSTTSPVIVITGPGEEGSPVAVTGPIGAPSETPPSPAITGSSTTVDNSARGSSPQLQPAISVAGRMIMGSRPSTPQNRAGITVAHGAGTVLSVRSAATRSSPATQQATPAPPRLAKLPLLPWRVAPVMVACVWLGLLFGSVHASKRSDQLREKIVKSPEQAYNTDMTWWRKSLLGLCSVLLLLSLLGGAQAVGANLAFRKPDKIEQWLTESKFYDHFVDNALEQAAKKDTSLGQTGTVSLDTPSVKQAAQQAFTPQMLQKNVEIFLNGNYDWLRGKAAKPTFAIDVSGPKQRFAGNVGHYVEDYLQNLPACTPAELAQLQGQNAQTLDPLTLTCRPPGLDPASEASLVAQHVQTNDSFLGTTTLTPDSQELNPSASSKPYYRQLSWLPMLYKIEVALPWIYGVIAILSLTGLIFLSARKRQGAKIAGIVFGVAGLLLVAIKLVADQAFTEVEHRLVNTSSSGLLQQSLTDFLHRVETYLIHVDATFGLAYLGVAAVLLLAVWATRKRDIAPSARPVLESAPAPAPPEPSPPKAPRPPRLVQ